MADAQAEEVEDEEEEVSQEELFPPSKAKPKKRTMAEELELPLPPPRPVDEALPPLDLLDMPKGGNAEADEAELQRLGELLLATLKTFKVEGTLAGITSGPTVSQFEVVPASGVKAGRIVALADDLAITMRAQSLRVAPIPGRGAVGVEDPQSEAPDGHAARVARERGLAFDDGAAADRASGATSRGSRSSPTSRRCRTCSSPARLARASRSRSTRSSPR
ncbi:MAG: DNA translocase FtsK [Gemmatimonadales bacterium]